MNGEQNASIFHAAFVTLGFVFRNAHTNQGSSDSTYRSAYASSSQGCHNRAGSDKWPQAGNGNGADAEQPSHGSADDRSRSSAGGCTLRRLRVLFMRKIFRPRTLWE